METRVESCDPARLATLLESEAEVSPGAALSEGPGTRIGRYKLLQLIGEGGFGSVFMAEQEAPVIRKVALKIIKLGMDTKQVIARFEAERQALAIMDHPSIAKVLDAGATGSGRPYFVMELVRGVPITDFCNEKKMTTRQRLELFVPVCGAVQHAHQKGIIHRDLKPNNVLVTTHDDKPVPMIIDFGVAKATQGRLTEKTLFTEFHQFIGTPQYMSPEQAQLNALDIDTRSDIYSLGVLLYELLTGTTPFDPKELRGAAYEEMRRIIREVEPPAPSTRMSTLAAGLQSSGADHRRSDAGTLSRTLKGDLDWIVMKCLDKDRSRRYETANGLARDISCYLADETVEASPPSAIYKLRKLARKHRRQAVAIIAVTIALVLGIIGTTMGLTQARRNLTAARKAELQESTQRKQSDRSALAAQEAKKTAELNLADALIAQGDALAASEKWPVAKARYRQAMDLLKAQGQSPFLAEVALWDANRRSPDPLLEIQAHMGGVKQLRFLPDGRQFATIGMDGAGHIWETRTGRRIRTFANLGDVQHLGISPDGQFIAFASMTGGATLWRIADGTLVRTIRGFPGRASAICFSPNAPRVLIGTADAPYDLHLVDFESGELIRTFKGHHASIRDVSFSPDGRRAASCDGRPPDDKLGFRVNVSLSMWEVSTGTLLWHCPADQGQRLVGAVAFSPDGGAVVCTCWDGVARLYDVETGSPQLLIRSERGRDVQGVVFSSGGLLAVGGPAGSVRILEAVTNYAPSASGNHPMAELRRFGGHVGETRTVDFSPDGRVLASGGGDGTVRLWPVNGGAETRVFSELHKPTFSEVFFVALSSDGLLALSCGNHERLVRLWDVASGTEISTIGTNDGHQVKAAFGPGDKTIVLIEKDGRIGVWENAFGRRLCTVDPPTGRQFESLGLSPDGKMLLAYYEKGSEVGVFDIAANQLVADMTLGNQTDYDEEHDDRRLCFSPDGTFAVGFDKSANVIKIWNTANWRERRVIAVPRPHRLAVSPDSRSIACTGADVRVFDAQSGRMTHHFDLAADQLAAVAFLHNPRYLVTEGVPEDGLVLWDLANGTYVRAIGEGNYDFDLAVSADGTLLWSHRSSQGTVNVAHLDWVRTNDALSARLKSSRSKLETDPNDVEALTTLGQWYAFRGMPDWAIDLLDRAGRPAAEAQ